MTLEEAAAHIARVDPAFKPFIEVSGALDLPAPDGDYLGTLLQAIVFQQLAGRAASAIHGRFVALYDGKPTAPAILQTSMDDLRKVGLSGNKVASVLDLAAKVADGTVPLDRLDGLSDDEVVERLSSVRGIGRWTAEMFLLFQLRRLDVWPVDDFGVRKGYARIHGLAEPPKPKALLALGEIYRPYRSVAAWYCWRAVETVLPDS